MTSLQKTGSRSLVEGQSTLLSEEITIFLFDCSGSMGDRIADDGSFKIPMGFYGSKFHAMKNAAIEFVKQRLQAIQQGSKDSVGVILFGLPGGYNYWSKAETVKLIHDPFNHNYELLLQKLDRMKYGGRTPMAEAVDLAIQTAERFTTGMIRVVICSDGQPDYKASVLNNVTRGFEEYGIIFDTIGVGEGYGIDETFLKLVASIGGGEYTKINSFQEFQRKLLQIEAERQLLLGNGILLLPEK